MKTLEEVAAESPESALTHCPVGTRITFAEEKTPYRVRARSSRYLVCTRPYNPKKTVFYTVVDLQERVRGTENLVFGFGAEKDDDCVAMVERLCGIMKPVTYTPKEQKELREMPQNLRRLCRGTFQSYTAATEVSHRNRVPLQVIKVVLPS